MTSPRPGPVSPLIRSCREADLESVRAMWRRTWRDSYAARVGPAFETAVESSLGGDAIRSMFADDGDCLLALEGDAVLGSVCFAERGAVAYVWGMYVRPDRQRRGIGTALIRAAAETFGTAGWIDLSAVDDRARALYRKLGFQEQGAGDIELFPGIRVPATRLVIAVADLRLILRP